jgi:hypothetical protein
MTAHLLEFCRIDVYFCGEGEKKILNNKYGSLCQLKNISKNDSSLCKILLEHTKTVHD